MEDNLMRIEGTSFDTELIKHFKFNSEVELAVPEHYFNLLKQKLPISGSMVTGGKLLCEKSAYESNDLWMSFLKETISSCLAEENIDILCKCCIIGDNMINYAYIISSNLFIQNMWEFFSIPQDTYVIFEEYNIYFQYTYEDELYFYKS